MLTDMDSEFRRYMESSQAKLFSDPNAKHEIINIPSDEMSQMEPKLPKPADQKSSSGSSISLDNGTVRKRSSKIVRITSQISYEKPKLSTTTDSHEDDEDDFEKLKRKRQAEREQRNLSMFEKAKEYSEAISLTRLNSEHENVKIDSEIESEKENERNPERDLSSEEDQTLKDNQNQNKKDV